MWLVWLFLYLLMGRGYVAWQSFRTGLYMTAFGTAVVTVCWLPLAIVWVYLYVLRGVK